MAKKYYAVAKGKTPGIYFTWDDCKSQIDQFSGAVYKGFETIQEAEAFVMNILGEQGENDIVKSLEEAECETSQLDGKLLHKEETYVEDNPISSEEHLIAYVDGSYDHSQLRYAYGCVLVLPEKEVTLNGSDNHPDYVSMRNVAGEIIGSEQAILWAITHGYKSVTVYYDYEGIEKWADGVWKTNKPGTRSYKAFIDEKRNEIQISFRKVAAHTGVKYNEMADRMAKEALGLG